MEKLKSPFIGMQPAEELPMFKRAIALPFWIDTDDGMLTALVKAENTCRRLGLYDKAVECQNFLWSCREDVLDQRTGLLAVDACDGWGLLTPNEIDLMGEYWAAMT